MADRLAEVELLDVEVRDPDPPRLALVDELDHRRPRVLERRSGRPVGPVHLVEVDALDAEAGKATLTLLADRLGTEVVADRAVRAAFPPPSTLREDEHLLADAIRTKGAPDDLLRVSQPVDGGGVDPVHAELDRTPDRGDRVFVVDLAPAEAPRPADRPGTEADDAQLRPEAAEAASPHERVRPLSSR